MPIREAFNAPIYQRIKQVLKERIEKGELAPGERVPSENELAKSLGVSRSQTRQALRDLEMEGYLDRSRGRASVVASPERWGAGERADRVRKVVVACPAKPRSYYTERLVESFVNYVSHHGIETMFYYLNLNPEAELRFLSKVQGDGVAGLALWPVFRTREVCDLVNRMYRLRFPCVLFDHFLPGLHTDFVGTDNRDAYLRLTVELARRGHKHIEYLARDFHDTVQDDRYAAYRRALDEAGLAVPTRLPVEVGMKGENPNAEAVVEDLLSRTPRCTAVVCSDGLVARFLVGRLGRMGLRVPEDVEVASMDDEDPDLWSATPLLRAVQDGAEVGRQTAEVLLARISLPGRPVEQRLIRASLPEEGASAHAPGRPGQRRKEVAGGPS